MNKKLLSILIVSLLALLLTFQLLGIQYIKKRLQTAQYKVSSQKETFYLDFSEIKPYFSNPFYLQVKVKDLKLLVFDGKKTHALLVLHDWTSWQLNFFSEKLHLVNASGWKTDLTQSKINEMAIAAYRMLGKSSKWPVPVALTVNRGFPGKSFLSLEYEGSYAISFSLKPFYTEFFNKSEDVLAFSAYYRTLSQGSLKELYYEPVLYSEKQVLAKEELKCDFEKQASKEAELNVKYIKKLLSSDSKFARGQLKSLFAYAAFGILNHSVNMKQSDENLYKKLAMKLGKELNPFFDKLEETALRSDYRAQLKVKLSNYGHLFASDSSRHLEDSSARLKWISEDSFLDYDTTQRVEFRAELPSLTLSPKMNMYASSESSFTQDFAQLMDKSSFAYLASVIEEFLSEYESLHSQEPAYQTIELFSHQLKHFREFYKQANEYKFATAFSYNSSLAQSQLYFKKLYAQVDDMGVWIKYRHLQPKKENLPHFLLRIKNPDQLSNELSYYLPAFAFLEQESRLEGQMYIKNLLKQSATVLNPDEELYYHLNVDSTMMSPSIKLFFPGIHFRNFNGDVQTLTEIWQSLSSYQAKSKKTTLKKT